MGDVGGKTHVWHIYLQGLSATKAPGAHIGDRCTTLMLHLCVPVNKVTSLAEGVAYYRPAT
jgi:hypothetical protein